MNKHIKKVKVKDLETSITNYTYTNNKTKIKGDYTWHNVSKGFLDQIPEEYHNREIYIVNNRTSEEAYSEVFKTMNERYVLKQLELNLQATDLREIFYMVRRTMNGELNLNVKDPAKGIAGTIKRYCDKLCKHLGYKYWAYIYDYLIVKPKETIIIYDTDMNTTTLSSKNLNDYVKTPFFLIICEKEEPLRATMEEMINRGYTKGFYGVVLGGVSTSYNIKLLIELSEIRNFYAFIMMDLDFAGINIFLDMVKWFPCESIGITPEMLDFIGVDFEDGCENYKPKNIRFEKMFKDYNIDVKEREKYRIWKDICIEKRFEINSLTTLRLKQDFNLNKTRDFCNYLISKIEDPNRNWNLNRYAKPIYEEISSRPTLQVQIPDFIDDVKEKIHNIVYDIINELQELIDKIINKQDEIKEEAYKEFYDYLESKELRYEENWKELIEDKYNDMDKKISNAMSLLNIRSKIDYKKILRKNRNYKGEEVIKEAENIIDEQTNQLYRLRREQRTSLNNMYDEPRKQLKELLEQTPEYKEIKEIFTENEKKFTETNFLDYIINLQEELNKMFKELIETINSEDQQ